MSAIQTVAEAPEAEMGLRRRGAWKNGETLGRFRLGFSWFNERVSAALRWACEEAAGRISEHGFPFRRGERRRS